MARSVTSLCNMAFNLIGETDLIIDITTDKSVNADVCNLLYPEIRNQVLSDPQVEWVCARTRKKLSSTTAPDFGWSYAYTLPAGCLRVIAQIASDGDTRGIPWRRESNKLLTNQDECYILYIQQIRDVTQFSPYLAKAIYTMLASELATRISGNKVKANDLLIVYREEVLPNAVAANQAEQYIEDEEGHTKIADAGR